MTSTSRATLAPLLRGEGQIAGQRTRMREAERLLGPAVLDHRVHVAGRLEPRHIGEEEADALVPARSYAHHRSVTARAQLWHKRAAHQESNCEEPPVQKDAVRA